MKHLLITISILALIGCNTIAVSNDYDDSEILDDVESTANNNGQEYLDAYVCYATTDYDKKTVISLITYRDNPEDGYVTLSDDVLYGAYHQYKGIERQWDFDCDENGCDYAIILKPTGSAHYYDFSESKIGDTVNSSYVLDCEINEDFTRTLNEGYIERHYKDIEREEYKNVSDKYEI